MYQYYKKIMFENCLKTFWNIVKEMYPKRENEKKKSNKWGKKNEIEKRKGIHKIYISKFYNSTIFLIVYKNNALWARQNGRGIV